MKTEITITLKDEYLYRYQEKYPLIQKEALVDFNKLKDEGVLLNLYDTKKRFIAKGYYGLQNKGFGWVLTDRKDEKIDADFFTKKIESALSYREEFFSDKESTAFRVFNGEGDGVGGLTIDYFDGFYMITWYSIGIYAFKEEILQALKRSVTYRGIYQKKRFNTKGNYLDESDDFVCGERAPEPLYIKENGINFAIYLDDGAMVGIFLDQRNVRRTLREKYSKGKTVLNTFSYTGAFSLYSALGGAKETTSVDLAKRSVPKTKEHFEANSVELSSHKFLVEDVFNYFKYALRKKISYDVVVVDPPSFARSKKHTFSAKKDYVNLLKEVIAITNKNGIIVASTNASNFSMMTFRDFIARAFKEIGGKYRVEESFSLPKDFRVLDKFKESDYLKVVFIRKLK
jgi:23S rRNA (cytosine1962-C5)-methyltransferase